MADATIVEVKNFFEISDMSQFRKEWNALSEEEKSFFKREVGKVLNK